MPALADPSESALCQVPPGQGQSPADSNPRIGSGQDYVLGAGDIILVTVIGIPGLEKQEYTLDAAGRISLPYINQVKLSGLTAHDAQVKIAARFEVDLLENPQVAVKVKEYKSQFYWILGAVSKPGRYPLAQQMFLIDALTTAGGLTDKADVQVRIRHGVTDPNPQASASPAENEQTINLAELFYNGDPSRNLGIRTGDVITVPERKESLYYVLGDVTKQGAFPIEKGEKPTLSRAVANAGGILKTAAPGKSMIIRPIPGSDMPKQIKVDIMSVVKGNSRDVELQQNDIVWVPGSATKTLGRGMMGGLNGIFGTLLLIGIR
jgi:polysaccharide export outer membrane protein